MVNTSFLRSLANLILLLQYLLRQPLLDNHAVDLSAQNFLRRSATGNEHQSAQHVPGKDLLVTRQ